MSQSLSPERFVSRANHGGDQQVLYTFAASNSRDTRAAATTFGNGVNQRLLELEDVSRSQNALVITYYERITVELPATPTGLTPHCSCVAYLEGNSCGHTGHAIDAMVRAAADQYNQQVVNCNIYQKHSTAAIRATFDINGEDVDIDPTQLDLDRLDLVIRRHTYAEVKLRTIVKNVRETAGEIFRYQSEHQRVRGAHNFELIRDIEGGMEYSTNVALRDLADEASRLNTAVEAFYEWASSPPVLPAANYQYGINQVTRAFIFMMRGILASIGQHNMKAHAADHLYHRRQPNFWQQADKFFVKGRRDYGVLLEEPHIADLTDLREFIRQNYEHPADEPVDRLFDRWLPPGV